MAAASASLGSAFGGTTIFVNYDDQTLVVSSISFTCGVGASAPLTWWYETTAGDYNTGIVQPGQAVTAASFPKGFTATTGTLGIVFPFLCFGFGHAAVITPPIAVVVGPV